MNPPTPDTPAPVECLSADERKDRQILRLVTDLERRSPAWSMTHGEFKRAHPEGVIDSTRRGKREGRRADA